MNDREQLLREIDKVGFALDDITLYLDTHPTDEKALEYFEQNLTKKKELMEQFASQYEPLEKMFVCPKSNNKTGSHTKYGSAKHFTWADGPIPWEGGAN